MSLEWARIEPVQGSFDGKAVKQVDAPVQLLHDGGAGRIKKFNIDAFVVGDDWYGKYDYLKDADVQVFYFPYGTGVSSSSLRKTIHDSYEKHLQDKRKAKPVSVKTMKVAPIASTMQRAMRPECLGESVSGHASQVATATASRSDGFRM